MLAWLLPEVASSSSTTLRASKESDFSYFTLKTDASTRSVLLQLAHFAVFVQSQASAQCLSSRQFAQIVFCFFLLTVVFMMVKNLAVITSQRPLLLQKDYICKFDFFVIYTNFLTCVHCSCELECYLLRHLHISMSQPDRCHCRLLQAANDRNTWEN